MQATYKPTSATLKLDIDRRRQADMLTEYCFSGLVDIGPTVHNELVRAA